MRGVLERLVPDNLRVTVLTKNAKYLETKVSGNKSILIFNHSATIQLC